MRRTILTMIMSASLMATAAWADDTVSDTLTNDQALGDPSSSQKMDQMDVSKKNAAGTVATDDTASRDLNMKKDANSHVNAADNSVKPDDTIIYTDNQKAGSAETTTADMGEYKSALKNETVGLKPQVGVVYFNDPVTGNKDTRAAYGATLDFNFTKMATSGPTPFYVGLSTGGIYSHLGGTNANFFGTNGIGGQNIVQIPANLKVGYNLTDNFRLGVHGGGNVIYRSQANGITLGSGNVGTGSDWSIFPNAGADLEFGIGRNTALIIRPDATFTTGENLYTGTLGFSIALG